MKRRDFNRLVVGAGVSPIFAKSSLAQMSAEELKTAPSKAADQPSLSRIRRGPIIRSMFRANIGGSTTLHHLLDLELSLGSQSRRNRAGQSFLDDDRGAPSRLAALRDT